MVKKSHNKKSLHTFFSNKFYILVTGLILLVLIEVCFLTYSAFTGKTANQTHVITLTEYGFSPATLTIQKGDTLTFKTTREKTFWPASNLHPTHTIFPEFDPQEPIEPDTSWSFTFNKLGTWKYHDHLAPSFEGSIIVTDKTSQDHNNYTASLANRCQTVSTGVSKLKCFDELIDYTVKKKGLDEAFAVFSYLFDKDPDFATDCHQFAHRLGQKSYELFVANQDFSLSTKTKYCGYGFYHGFMEKLVQNTNDMSKAREFCELADKKLALQTSDAGGACFHGIGHGAVEDVPDKKVWGNPQAIIAPALELCEKVSDTKEILYRCITGVYNGLEIISTAKKYDLSLNPDDPMWICKIQKESYKEACFTQLVVAVMHVTGTDFAKSAEIIDLIPEDNYAIPALASLVVERVRLNKIDYQETIDYCRGLPSRFHNICIISFGEGFLKYGPPEQEYVKARDFCASPLLTEEEKTACFTRIFSILRIWYPAEKATEICKSVDSKYWLRNCQYS